MAINVTGKQVAAAVMAAGINRVDHHECGICGCIVCYWIVNGELYFDAGCFCSPYTKLEFREWDDAARWINMQTSVDSQIEIMKRFGLAADGPPVEMGDFIANDNTYAGPEANTLHCEKCGDRIRLKMPMAVEIAAEIMRCYSALHQYCGTEQVFVVDGREGG